MGCTIDIDTGGTFTDGFFFHLDRAEKVKVSTTAHDLTVCFLECIRAGARRLGLTMEDLLSTTEIIRFSNTIGTNTIIQRDGSKVGLLATAGRENLAPTRSDDGKSPLVAPDMVVGIDEETAAGGEVLRSPDEQSVMRAAQELIDRGARCLVVAFVNSQYNPANERLVRNAVKKEYPRDYLGSVPVFLSSDISFRSGETARINSAVISAYIHGKLARLLYKAEEELRKRHYNGRLFIGHNNGSVARVAKTRAINTYNSGPAAGLSGAALMSRLYNAPGVISGDMGGTSFDLGWARDGEASFSLESDVEGFPVNIPMLEIKAIGAGGGSIASVKEGELLVGPRSAGALPGPACFDLGGVEPTVTDADLVIGLLDPDRFLGGGMKLNREKALQAVREKVAKPLGISVEEAALGIRRTIDRTMGRELGRIKATIFPGVDPLFLVYGGAGPGHCADIAKEAGIRRILITPFSSVFSAYSSAGMDVGHVYYRRLDLPVRSGTGQDGLHGVVDGLRTLAERDMRGEGFAVDQIETGLEWFFSYGDKEVRLPSECSVDKLPDMCRRAREKLDAPGEETLILTCLGLRSTARVPHYPAPSLPETSRPLIEALKGTRSVHVESNGTPLEMPVYDLTLLEHGHKLDGPALIESDYTIVYLPTHWKTRIDRHNHLLIEEV